MDFRVQMLGNLSHSVEAPWGRTNVGHYQPAVFEVAQNPGPAINPIQIRYCLVKPSINLRGLLLGVHQWHFR